MTKTISKTLIVGLGGTGQTVIRDIKKRLLRTYGEIPNLVRFIEFDTDAIDNKDSEPFEYYYGGKTHKDFKYLIEPREFFQIPYSGVDVVIRDPVCSEKLDLDELRAVSDHFGDAGTAGYRIKGRACFLNSSQVIIQMLSIAIRDLRNVMLPAYDIARGYNVVNNGNISVFVVASLAGGTGSSAIMDISRMLQIAGINVHYNNDAALDKIFGVFFLPGFFEANPNTANIRINAYTALSELDYTMGLADPIRYALGCRELEDDRQDYIGNPNNGKRVIYDNVFLIDSLTSKGHTHSIADASIDVASFIAGSIAADPYSLISSYVNSDHKLQTVDGKHQNYSGLGYCEIRFCRQELVKYLLNRQLRDILNAYKMGDSWMDMDKIADAFIANNHLNEGIMSQMEGIEDTRFQLNELTDAIYMLNDRRFTGIVMGSVATGKEADLIIQANKDKYINSITTEATEAVKGFALKKRQILENLDQLLKDRQTQKGFGNFPDLAKRLKWSFENMKLGLEDEMMQHEAKQKQIENDLKKTKNLIKENSGTGFFGIGSKKQAQSAAIMSYRAKVDGLGTDQNPTLMRLKLEMVRKEEAIKVYEEMIKMVESYYKEEEVELGGDKKSVRITGSSLEIQQVFDALKGLLDSENNAYQPSKAAKNETIFVDAYFKEYFESHDVETMTLTEQDRAELDAYLSNLFADLPAVNEATLADMRQTLLGLMPTDGIIRCIQEGRLSIDELFIHCFGIYASIKDIADLEANPQLGLLEQLNHAIDPLWCYKHFTRQGLSPVKNLVVGVYDIQNHIFCSQNGYQAAIFRGNWDAHINYISLGDPDRIAFMVIETGIPACELVDVSRWAIEYDHKKQYVYTFSDKRLEGIDMIMPRMYDEATNGRHE